MKKNYFFTLLLTLCFSVLSFGQDLIITGVIDGPLPGGSPKGIELYAKNAIPDLSIYGVESTTNGAAAAGVEYTFPADVITAGTFIYLANNGSSAGFTQYLGVTPQYENGVLSVNGDDTVILYKNGTIEDSIGEIGVDGTGTTWDHLDGWAYRKNSKGPNATFDASEWTYSGANALDGCDLSDDSGTNAGCSSVFPVGTYSAVASTTPSLTLNSPGSGSIASTTSVSPTITVDNFTVSGDNGSGASDNSGDGYIKSTFETQGGSTEGVNFFSTILPAITVAPGNTYTLTLELVDNAGASLNPAVSKSVTFTIEHPCDLILGDIATTCDISTSGNDGYSGSIAFTGGNTGITYTITAPAGVTVAGDNPDTVAAGIITFTGMTEGTNAGITIVGGANSSCDYTRTLFSPNCIPFPIVETFNYTTGTDLIAADAWSDASTSSTPNNIQVVAAALTNPFTSAQFPDPTGNMITLSGGGSDPYIAFNASNEIFTSFLFTATDMSTVTNTNGAYFVVLAQPSGSFRARLWVKPDATDGAMYNIGVSTTGSSNYSTLAHTTGEQVFIVMSYNTTNDEVKVWIDPDPTTFEGTPAAASLTEAIGSTEAVGRFVLRQDSTAETAAINFDELRIDTTWSGVTPKGATASVVRNDIDGFAAYPNPVTNKIFTIRSLSTSNKEIKIFNVLGKKVFTQSFSGLQKTMDVSVLNSGIYILKVTEEGRTSTKKIVIR